MMPARPDSSGNLRLIIDPPSSGARNMAVDQALFEQVAHSDRPVLRFYQWEQPTLSLGYFQRAAARAEHAASRTCPMVRRSTGGGAIIHDAELTYCLAIPRNRLPAPLRADAGRLYGIVHRAAAVALAKWNITMTPAETCGQATPCARSHPSQTPFLCFQHITIQDGLIGRHKVLGSAQRRSRWAVMQHGSLLWRQSPAAPELPGIADLVPHAPHWSESTREAVTGAWRDAICRTFGWPIPDHLDELSNAESQAAARLVRCRYGNAEWNGRR